MVMLSRWSLFVSCVLLLSLLACEKKVPRPRTLHSFQVTFSTTNPAQISGVLPDPNKPGSNKACLADSECDQRAGESCIQDKCQHQLKLSFASGVSCTQDADCPNPEERCTDALVCGYLYLIDIQAMDSKGQPMTDFNGPVSIDITPGKIIGGGLSVDLKNGVATNVKVAFNLAYERTLIWVEDTGVVPKTSTYSQCNDGLDNDGNGLIDLADPGCQDKNDNLESTPTFASGASPIIWFRNPTIRNLNFTPYLSKSPLQGKNVFVVKGDLVVTNVINGGYYLTDLNDHEAGKFYNSMFLFTFSNPLDVFIGDTICNFSGAVFEFTGTTQIQFPSYEVFLPSAKFDLQCVFEKKRCVVDGDCGANRRCVDDPVFAGERFCKLEVPPPVVLEKADLADDKLLEKYESALVQVRDVQVGTKFILCDRNQNGNYDPGEETDCRNDCQGDPLCIELGSYFEFAQWDGFASQTRKYGFSYAIANLFKPLDIALIGSEDRNGVCSKGLDPKGFLIYTCPPRTLKAVTGSLRQVYLCGENQPGASCPISFWVVEPRNDFDVVLDPDVDNDGDGYTINQGDCNDSNKFINPGATEIPGNNIDENCDGQDLDPTKDNDGDGFTIAQGDCNDSDNTIHPNATEIPNNGKDENCDGQDLDPNLDNDGDGFTINQGDCDDSNRNIHPNAIEDEFTGRDENCDGVL